MRLLLDTHIWLWSIIAPDRLSKRVAHALIVPENELWLSPISVWEAAILVERGRIRVGEDPAHWIDRALHAAPIREAPLTFDVAVASRALKLVHSDPADRFLAASAKIHDLTLVTSDLKLLQSKVCQLLSNR